MSDVTQVKLTDVPDLAAGRPGSEGIEARFAREALGLTKQGLTRFRFGPGVRTPFGHRHTQQEEVYVVVTGTVRVNLGDRIVELGPWDALRVAPEVTRCIEGGPEGAELLAIGAPAVPHGDGEMIPGWWPDAD